MKQNHGKIVKQILIVFLSSGLVMMGLFTILLAFALCVPRWWMPAVGDPFGWLSLLLGVSLGVLMIYGGIRLFKDIKNP